MSVIIPHRCHLSGCKGMDLGQDQMQSYGNGRECELRHYGVHTMSEIFDLYEDPEHYKFKDNLCNTLEYLVTYPETDIHIQHNPNLFKHLVLYHMKRDMGDICKCVTKKLDGDVCTRQTISDILDVLVNYIKEVNKKDEDSLSELWTGIKPYKESFQADDKDKIYNIFCDLVEIYTKETNGKQEKEHYYDEMPGQFMFRSKTKKSKRVKRTHRRGY
jgi:hypothetical protein